MPAIVAVGHTLGAVLRPDLDAAGTPLGSRPVPDPATTAALSRLIKMPVMDWDRWDL